MNNSFSEHSALPSKPLSDMSLVDIAEELEKITSWIEGQNVREREARAAYDTVRRDVDAKISQIKDYAKKLLEQQQRRVHAFGGLLGSQQSAPAPAKPARQRPSGEPKQNLADAICEIWRLDSYSEPLNMEQIVAALSDVGWTSTAAPGSLRSSINQSLGKLSKVGRVVRYRGDGTRISIRDTKSRAKKYIAAFKANEVED